MCARESKIERTCIGLTAAGLLCGLGCHGLLLPGWPPSMRRHAAAATSSVYSIAAAAVATVTARSLHAAAAACVHSV